MHPQNTSGQASLYSIDEASDLHSVETDTLNAAMSGPEKPSYKDYLKAQRNLHHHHHHHHRSSTTLHSHSHHKRHGASPPTSSSTMHSNKRQQMTDSAYTKNLQSMAMLGGRQSLLSDTSLWDAIMESPHAQPEAAEEHADGHHEHHHTGKVPFYAPPMQRVFWGKPQVLPHVNWGDLFFDLFFVAMAYNMGTMLISSLNDTDWLRGLIYFVAVFGALFQTWYNDLAFSSRYTVLDHVHRLIWGLKFFSVAGAIMFITPIELMGDPHSFETLGFIAAVLLEHLITTGLTMEVYFNGMGDRIPIEKHCKRSLRNYHLPTIIMYTAALVLAVMAFVEKEESDYGSDYGNDYGTTDSGYGSDYGTDSGYGSDYGTDSDYAGNSTSAGSDYGNSTRFLAAAASDVSCSSGSRLLLARMLGASEVECTGRRLAAASDDCSCHTGALLEMRDLPLGIICFAYFFNIFYSLFRSMCLASKGSQKDIRDRFVPNNLDYVIHRYGEWIMLMIGESVLSLLIVETIESSDYFVISCLGVLNVMLVHTLIFESQPSTSAGHAIFRSFKGQLSFGLLVQVLSMGLIAFGTCFKIMLSTVLAEASSYGRRLAGKVSVSNEMTAALFSISLTVVLISLELMLVTHKGTKETFARLWKNRDGGAKGIHKKIHKPLLALTITKLGLIAFVATLSQWENELTEISWIGLIVTFAMLASRVIVWGVIHKEDDIRELFKNGLNKVMPTKKQQEEADYHVPLNDIEEGNDEDNTSREISVNRGTWDKSGECIVVLNKQGSIKYANKMALTEFGYKSELDVIGKDISVLSKDHGQGEDRRQHFKDMGRLESHRVSWNDSMDIVIVIDRKGLIQFANPVTLKEFGYDSDQELIGKDIAVLVGGGEAMNHANYMKAMESGKTPSKVIGTQRSSSGKKRLLYAKRKDGTEFPCLIGLKPIGTDYIAGFIKDLSDLSSMENYSKEQFITAASEGNAEEVKRFLTNSTVEMNKGDYDKRTALHLAADYGHEEVIKLLCEAGADVNVEDRWGHRPLDDAIWGQHKECVVLLKKFGAERGKKRSVSDLIGASAKGAADEVRTILDEGDVNHNGCDYDGRTCLHVAACEGHVSVVEVLCEAGANLDALDRWGRTPLDEAELHGQMACMEMLQKYGAKGESNSPDDPSVDGGLPLEVVDETTDSIIVTNYDGVIQKLNTTALASFGYESDAELIGHNISILVQDEYVGRKSFGGSLQPQRVSHGKHKNGSKFPCIVDEQKDKQRHLLISYIKDVSELERRGSLKIQSIDMSGFAPSSHRSSDSGSIKFRESLHDL